ncbi:MAG: Rrf2 family transcriptional regulator [Melioribacteraceae bacterium]|nr:Rrf2 family transcriptional regulator [Melioribacteraceae bacterium]MCF8266198.1 Rrf2 family transcriptional regulator [Melioribacteraceae bacterium]MCF8413197.1 Rrf2 family transcriptional regulator [Melioribacteraceae bacterium]MCF8432066.1 Rrf2 family transcriptional regulator [Melioribacteraceae bacterium]
MTVIFSKKCEVGLQSVLYLSFQENGKVFNALEISEKVKQPKEFVSKMLQILALKGIVGSKKGKNGGFFMAKDPRLVRLIDIVVAIDGMDIFNNCVLGFEGCGTSKPCPVHDKWGVLRDEAFQMLNRETLADLREKSKEKILSLI